jgi:hypothetical protein
MLIANIDDLPADTLGIIEVGRFDARGDLVGWTIRDQAHETNPLHLADARVLTLTLSGAVYIRGYFSAKLTDARRQAATEVATGAVFTERSYDHL